MALFSESNFYVVVTVLGFLTESLAGASYAKRYDDHGIAKTLIFHLTSRANKYVFFFGRAFVGSRDQTRSQSAGGCDPIAAYA